MAGTPRYVVRKVGDRYITEPVASAGIEICSLCTAGGGLLALYGAGKGGWLGLGLTALGGGMFYRGLTGRNPVKLFRGRSSRARSGEASLGPSYPHDYRGRSNQLPADEIDEAAMESFPASDPPSRHAKSEPEPSRRPAAMVP